MEFRIGTFGQMDEQSPFALLLIKRVMQIKFF